MHEAERDEMIEVLAKLCYTDKEESKRKERRL